MAKRLHDVMIQLVREDVPGGSPWCLRVLGYGLDSDTDAGARHDPSGTVSPAPPRDLTAPELSGTLQAFLDGCETACEDAESI